MYNNVYDAQMSRFCAERMARIRNEGVYSRRVVLCIDHIYAHLRERRTGTTPREYRNRFFRSDALRGDR